MKNKKISLSLIAHHKNKKKKQQQRKDIKIISWIMFIAISIGVIAKHDLKTIQPTMASAPEYSLFGKLPESEDRILDPEKKYYYLLETNENFRNYINSIIVKRNNPGNLRCGGQPSSTCDNGFANYKFITFGFRGLIKQIELDQSRNLTLEQFINKYSPPHENDTPHLINRAEQELKATRGQNINEFDTIKLAMVMTKQEWSIPYPEL